MNSSVSLTGWRDHPLTRDNTLLSRPKISAKNTLDQEVERYIHESVSKNTRRAYRFDLAHFKNWGGSLPSEPQEVARYLTQYAETLAPATLARRIATLSKAHAVNEWPNPCRSDTVQNTLKGIRRVRGTAQQQANPLLKEDLFIVLDNFGKSARCKRDRALLLLGWAGGMRASEIVSLNISDVETVPEGLILLLRHSKTDQESKGRKLGIPYGRTRHCPVSAFNSWMKVLPMDTPALFHPIDRQGSISPNRLRPDAVSLVLRRSMHEAGLVTDGFSGHSLRAGMITSATKAGVHSPKIRQQTGHASDVMLSRYVRDISMFEGNAVEGLL